MTNKSSVAVLILSRQRQISLTCTQTTSAQRSDLQIQETTLESFTADLSHSAGNTGAMEDSSLHSAICYAINARSQELQRNPAVQIAELSSQEPQHETATWRTRNASSDETHRTCRLFSFLPVFTFHLYCMVGVSFCQGFFFGVLGGKGSRGHRKIHRYGEIHFHGWDVHNGEKRLQHFHVSDEKRDESATRLLLFAIIPFVSIIVL